MPASSADIKGKARDSGFDGKDEGTSRLPSPWSSSAQSVDEWLEGERIWLNDEVIELTPVPTLQPTRLFVTCPCQSK